MATQSFSAIDANEIALAYARAVDADRRRIEQYLNRTAIVFANHLRRTYPIGPTGNLRGRVVVEQRNQYSWRTRALAPHTWLYEHGATRRGPTTARRVPGDIFVPAAVKYRAQAYQSIQALFDRTVEV